MAASKNTFQQFMAYLQNTLTDKERHALEKNTLSDPFEEEALEGMEALGAEAFQEDFIKLQQNFVKTEPKKGLLVSIKKYQMAASVLVVVGLGTLLYFTLRPDIQEIPATHEFDSNQIIVNDFEMDSISDEDAIVISEEVDEVLEDAPVSEPTVRKKEVQAPAAKSAREPVKTITIAKSKRSTTRGTITDQSKEPLPGIQVSIKGKEGTVVSDFDGNYSIASEPNDTLVFDGLGFETAFRPSDDAEIVVLDESNAALEEVVTIGYGTAKKSELSGATVSVQDSSVTEATNANAAIPPQGSMEGFKVWLLAQLSSRYARTAKKDTVHFEFTVDKKGQLIDFKHDNKKNKRLLRKIEKLVLESPAWQPAQSNGEATTQHIRIEFKNENE